MTEKLRALMTIEEYIELRNKASEVGIRDVRMTGYDKLFPNETLYFLRAATSLNLIQDHLRSLQVQMKEHLFSEGPIDVNKAEEDLEYLLLYFLEICDGLDLSPIEIALKASKID